MLDRRRFLNLFAAAGAISATQGAVAQAPLPKVVVTKDPNCGCCGGWVDHMRAAGFPVDVVATPQVNRLKSRLGVPDDLASCHTAEVDECANVKYVERIELTAEKGHDNRPHDGAEHAALHARQ